MKTLMICNALEGGKVSIPVEGIAGLTCAVDIRDPKKEWIVVRMKDGGSFRVTDPVEAVAWKMADGWWRRARG